MAGEKCLKSFLESAMKARVALGGFDKNISKVHIISAKEGCIEAAMKIEKEHCNEHGTLHGGMSAYLVDMISTMSLYSPTHKSATISVDLNISFLAAAKLGSEITMTAHTLKRGSNLAFLTFDMRDSSTGKLLVVGKHTKFILS